MTADSIRIGRRSIRAGAFDHALQFGVGAALGVAAQRLHLGEVFLGLEQIALLGVPHAVIRPSDGVGRIGGECALVPDLGILVAAELAAGIADQVGDIGVVVTAERLQLVDRGGVVVALVDHRVRRLVAVDELLLGLLLVLFRRLLFLVGLGGLRRGGFRLRLVGHRARAVDGAGGER